MSAPTKLTVLDGDLGPWREASDQDARATLERILELYDRCVVIGVRRCDRGQTEYVRCEAMRERLQTSLFELTGAIHVAVREIEDGEP
jgi:hypothetical protein